MAQLILLNKPYGVLCQFSSDGSDKPTLKVHIDVPRVYPAGRLDTDSEGLLLLTDDGALQSHISHPKHKLPKTYWVQTEGVPSDTALERLRRGVNLKDGPTLPAGVDRLPEPSLWERVPPIRQRKNSPTGWLELTLKEGRNRQVRRMTAAVGFPTLRLIRVGVGPFHLGDKQPGDWERVEALEIKRLLPSWSEHGTRGAAPRTNSSGNRRGQATHRGAPNARGHRKPSARSMRPPKVAKPGRS